MHNSTLRWPVNPTLISMTWNLDDSILFLEYEYLQLEPIGLIFVLWFAVILFIQLLGMVTHRQAIEMFFFSIQ